MQNKAWVSRFSLSRCLLLALVLLLTMRPVAAETSTAGGPLHILITYRSAAADRPAFRDYLRGEGMAHFGKLKQDGVIASYQVLYNPFVQDGTWDAMLVLGFKTYTDTQKWKDIESTMPGGLTPAGVKLAHPLTTISADLMWSETGKNPGVAKDGVYYVIPYEYNNKDQYREYVDGYVIPQVKGWLGEGVLSSYRIYMNRYPVGPTTDALFIYQYRDLDAFGKREATVAKIRKTLKDDPVWKKWSDIKATIRDETENTITELLEPKK
ncbi:MAG: hypothetical protein K2P94_08775 [Rhodospirillaceae bacterium]|nr:hypothetical protein [Rhodospirillaceae bacterium]